MRYGIVDGAGMVVNVIEYDEAPTNPPPGFPEDHIAVQADHVGPGWTYVDGVLVEPPLPEPLPLPPVRTVTPRQARLALYNAGLLDQVEATVNAAGGTTKITWEYATEINRDDPLIETLSSSLGLTDAAIDLLFSQASTL